MRVFEVTGIVWRIIKWITGKEKFSWRTMLAAVGALVVWYLQNHLDKDAAEAVGEDWGRDITDACTEIFPNWNNMEGELQATKNRVNVGIDRGLDYDDGVT